MFSALLTQIKSVFEANKTVSLIILGTGIAMRLRFYSNTANKPIELYGYEVPGHTLGRR